MGVSQSGSLTQSTGAGAVTIHAGAGSIALNGSNFLRGPISLYNTGANNVALSNELDLILGTSSLGSGTLNLTSVGGSISQIGDLAKTAGDTHVWINNGESSAPYRDVILDSVGNNFGSGAVSISTL